MKLIPNTTSMRRQRGLSLIELMISMVIGLLILGGMISLFVSNKQTYRYNDELARLQENSRMTIDRIERTLRMAGHVGCPTLQEAQQRRRGVIGQSIVDNPQIPFNTLQAITATRYNPSNPGIVGTVGKTAKAGTDVVTVRFGQGASTTLDTATKDDIDPGDSAIVIRDNALGFKQGEAIVISDCKGVGLARVSNTPASGNSVTLEFKTSGGYNTNDGLPIAFGDDVRLMRMSNLSFFVGPSANTNRQGNAYNSLYLASEAAGSSADEIVEGVEDMVITYGVEGAGTPSEVTDKYVDVNSVTDWNDVVAVNISLLLASVDENVVDTAQSVTFNGKTYTDRRMYTTANMTVTLRRNFN